MRRLTAALTFSLAALALPALAADAPGHFKNNAAYEQFVDKQIMTRNFADAVHMLGGGDEYSAAELTDIASQLSDIYPQDFTHSAVLREVQLGQGFRQEVRAYWTEPTGKYLYFYALLHQRDDGLVVLSFSADTEADVIMEKF